MRSDSRWEPELAVMPVHIPTASTGDGKAWRVVSWYDVCDIMMRICNGPYACIPDSDTPMFNHNGRAAVNMASVDRPSNRNRVVDVSLLGDNSRPWYHVLRQLQRQKR